MTAHRLVLIAAAAVALLSARAAASQDVDPRAEVVATVEAALAAGLAGDMPKLREHYAADSTFADEFAPFFWTGPNALDRYLASGARMYQETQHRDGKTTASPPAYVYVSADRAFVVQSMSETATVRGNPYAHQGSFAYVLARTGGRWKIISQTWVKTSETMNPY